MITTITPMNVPKAEVLDKDYQELVADPKNLVLIAKYGFEGLAIREQESAKIWTSTMLLAQHESLIIKRFQAMWIPINYIRECEKEPTQTNQKNVLDRLERFSALFSVKCHDLIKWYEDKETKEIGKNRYDMAAYRQRIRTQKNLFELRLETLLGQASVINKLICDCNTTYERYLFVKNNSKSSADDRDKTLEDTITLKEKVKSCKHELGKELAKIDKKCRSLLLSMQTTESNLAHKASSPLLKASSQIQLKDSPKFGRLCREKSGILTDDEATYKVELLSREHYLVCANVLQGLKHLIKGIHKDLKYSN
ncbi:MAG: hypothetical protein K0S74_1032 [Chlamydiales bacterium]|jgi:hypothetical protein|nr:hypothetical protein [Chlamydiales bacterium]